jgi:hypothetical protein
LIAAGIGRGEPQQPPQSESSRPSLALQAFLALVLYCALLIPLGYIPATALFFCLEARLIERLTWPRACMLAAIATAASYGLFVLLDVQLPAGLWLE